MSSYPHQTKATYRPEVTFSRAKSTDQITLLLIINITPDHTVS